MPLYLAAYMRHKAFGVSLNSEATNITPTIADNIKSSVYNYFKTRLAKVPSTAPLQISEILTPKALTEIQNYLEEAFKEWLDKKAKGESQYFHWDRKPSLFVPIDAYEEEKNKSNWVVQSSVRIIESESILSVIE